MCLRVAEEGDLPASCFPLCQEESVYKTAKLVYKRTPASWAKSSMQCCLNSSPWDWEQRAAGCLPGWDGHIQSASASAEAHLLERMCSLMAAIDLPPTATNYFFFRRATFNLYQLNSDQNQDWCVNEPMDNCPDGSCIGALLLRPYCVHFIYQHNHLALASRWGY